MLVSKNKFYLKIILPSIISILLFILTIFFVVIPRFQNNIMNGKREMIKELTNSAWSILAKYENDEKKGLLTQSEAKAIAASRIQYLRYGEENKDYFWITDMYPRMVMHPYRSELNGKDLTNFKDPHGKRMFVEFVGTVKKSDHGYVDYMWQWKDDSVHIVSKLSYVKIFKPWGWVIGTGIYVEDVKKEINALTAKLLWISIGISFLIGCLLIYISQQSLKIEKKRADAEKELQQSKEKYKTLVEAATDGLIMLVDGKISFYNNVICKMTGYDSKEIINHPLDEIIIDSNNNSFVNQIKQQKLKEGKYELMLKNKEGNQIDVLITTTTAVLYENTVNIIIVKYIGIDEDSNLSNIDYQKLLSTLNIGFFKARIDTKGKFISANEKALRILGYNNFKELSDLYILELFTNSEDKKNLKKNLLENGYIKNKILKIKKRNNEIAIISVTLTVFNSDNSDELICDGIIEDITLVEKERQGLQHLITALKANSFIIEQSITSFVSPLQTLDSDATIRSLVKAMTLRKTDCMVLTKNERDCIGIVSGDDIQKRVFSLSLNVDNPAYLIMSSPLLFIREGATLLEAIDFCEEHKINHLLVKNNQDEFIGVLRLDDVYRVMKSSLSFLVAGVKNAETIDEIKDHYKSMQMLVKPLVRSDISAKYITNITSSFSDAVINRVFDLVKAEFGEAPVRFSFICLGSEGRKEETLFTDQDNAIIYEDVSAEQEPQIRLYFNKLSDEVCNALNEVGYSFCRGNIMAKNPQWCQSLETWKKYFRTWINTPDSQNLLEASIFFDFRSVYGEEELVNNLRDNIQLFIKNQAVFLYHMAHNTYNVKPQQFSDTLDIKSALNLIIMFARTYALQQNIQNTNTLDRLNALKSMQVLKDSVADEIGYVYNILMKLRFRNQVDLLENDMPLSNTIQTKILLDIEITILKKALTQIQIWQNKIGVDFRIIT